MHNIIDNAPALAKNVPIDRKRKACRPCLARPALERFTFHSLIEADETEIEQRFDEVLANELVLVFNSTLAATQPILNMDDVNEMLNTDLSSIPQVDFLDSVTSIDLLTPDASNDGISAVIAPVVAPVVEIEVPVSNLLLIGSQANQRKKDGQPRKERSDKGTKRAKKN